MTWWQLIAVLAGAGVAAAGLRWMRLPMWPITGGVIGAAAVHLALGGGEWSMPAAASPLAQLLVGAAVGCAISPSIFQTFARIVLPGTIAVIATVGTGLLLGALLGVLGLLDPTVAVLGMVPGGVGEMVAAAINLHTDSATVAAIHLIRLLVVIWSLPLLVRLARRLGGPGGSPDDDTKEAP